MQLASSNVLFARTLPVDVQDGTYERHKVQGKTTAPPATEFASKLTQTDWRSLMRKIPIRCIQVIHDFSVRDLNWTINLYLDRRLA